MRIELQGASTYYYDSGVVPRVGEEIQFGNGSLYVVKRVTHEIERGFVADLRQASVVVLVNKVGRKP